MDKTSECMLYLMACALNDTRAEESALAGVELEQLFRLARSHTVSAMVCMALEKTEVFSAAPEQTRKLWLDAKNKAIRKNMLLDAERGVILSRLEAEGIWYMPLKGSILKEWYPRPGMREMADNDILFDPAGREQVRGIFQQRGYTAASYKKGNHDVYEKPPIYNFEMHVALFSGQLTDLAEAYADVRERLLPVGGTQYGLRFSQEDFYVFVLAHAYKHYSHSGTGVRTLADIFVMDRKLGSTLDWNDVQMKLARLGIAEYEQGSRILAGKLFASARPVSELALTEKEAKQLCYHLDASAYGTMDNRVGNSLQELQTDPSKINFWTKLKYCRTRLFPGREFCKEAYPFVYAHPWTLPVFWVWRLADRLLRNHRGIRSEMTSLMSFEPENRG